MDAMEIRGLLPHRYPFLMVDRVSGLVPGDRCVGEKNLTWNEPCYADIPDSEERRDFRYPVSLMIESFAQAGALLCLASREKVDVGEEYVMLAGSVRDIRFLGEAYPGDVLVHEVAIARQMSDTVVLTGAIRKRTGGGPGPSVLADVAEIENVIIAIRPKAELMAGMGAAHA